MPTATTLPLIILLAILLRYTKGQILPCVLFTSVFTAASALNFGALGVAPWLFVLGSCIALKVLRGHRPYRFTMGVNRIALHLMIIFLCYTAFTGLVYPILFRGVTIMRVADPEPLSWGVSNIAQLCYLLAAAVLYFITISSTRDELKQAMEWYINGCVLAALIAMYQLMNAVAHVPYPDAVLYSNPSHVVYRAYMMNGMWRLNSTFSEASEMAGFMIVGIALQGWTIMTNPLQLKRTCAFALMLISLLLTMSSVGYLCLGYTFVMAIALYIRQMLRSGGLSPMKVVIGVALLSSFITLFTLSTNAGQVVSKVITSTLLEKTGSDSYRERVQTHVAALETLSETSYLGAGWGSVRASGLFYILLGNVGVPGLVLFLAFVGSLFIPLIKKSPHGRNRLGNDMIERSLFGMSTLFVAMAVAGAEPVAPVLWVLFGVATVAAPLERRGPHFDNHPPRPYILPLKPNLVSTAEPHIWFTEATSSNRS